MTDLVKRLRDAAKSGYDIYGLHCDIELEAADHIEKLAAALRDLSDGWECCPVSQAMRRVARKALEEKDE
ncbi:hypothetical protein UFOVP231_67 [uncultured Caudovirales phage]|uniref:Uncharacterized protein n=1 Tax=uncultured Caudovirales phage TaxID=2100421 RepID=A0A6J7WVI6_9CAUD|nr:hypothetical protein UFOVP231_67 [uncultured Caudovirales phage]